MRTLIPCAAVVLLIFAGRSIAQEWKYYGGDAGGSRYSGLDQINRKNVTRLKVAWTYDTGDVSDGTGTSPTRSSFEGTPLMIEGTLYVVTPFNRLIAIQPETGEKLWDFDPHIDRGMRANLFLNRGAAYWSDGNNSIIYYGDLHGRLWAIDAKSGKPEGWIRERRQGRSHARPDE